MTTKIISIGNITLGGTGKTPLTIKIGSYFIKNGYKVTILSRGYKGKIGKSPNVLYDGKKFLYHPPLAADEPYMIANNLKNCTVLTGKNRVATLGISKQLFHPDIAILDDAFQYRKLERDVNILLLNHTNPIPTWLPFPLGYLREFPSSIRRADIIIFTRADSNSIPLKVLKYITNQPVFFSKTSFKEIMYDKKEIDIGIVKDMTALAFSGIASNNNFFNILHSLDIRLTHKIKFMDHKRYSDKVIEKILKLAARKKVDIVITTEKDYVKIPERYKANIHFLKIETHIEQEKDFFDLLMKKIQ